MASRWNDSMIDKKYPVKLLLYNAIEGALLGNKDDLNYVLSWDCEEDCEFLGLDYNKLTKFIETRNNFMTVKEIEKVYLAAKSQLTRDIKNGKILAMKETWKSNRWRYIVPQAFVAKKYLRRLK